MTRTIAGPTAAVLALVALLLAGVAADCAGPDDTPGMYQGGTDSAPYWRR